jgi:hypothetical protein
MEGETGLGTYLLRSGGNLQAALEIHDRDITTKEPAAYGLFGAPQLWFRWLVMMFRSADVTLPLVSKSFQ